MPVDKTKLAGYNSQSYTNMQKSSNRQWGHLGNHPVKELHRVNRILKLSLILAIILMAGLFFGRSPGMLAQQAATEDVTILPLPVPTNVIGTYIRGASNDGKRLVLESINDYNGRNIDSNSEIWIYEVDSQRMIMITDTANIQETTNNADGTKTIKTLLKVDNFVPAISGDGTRIAFMSNAALGGTTNADGNFEIYLAEIPRGQTTATIRRITNTGANFTDEVLKEIASNYAPSISDDGRTIAFLSTRFFFNAIDGGPAAFTALKEGPNATEPDGNAEVFVYQESTRQYTQVTATRDIDATANFAVKGFNAAPYLSGNGRVLTFLSGFNFPGASANKNTDLNGEIFIHKLGDAVNTVTQVTQTNARSVIPINGPENVLAASTRPLNFDGTKMVFESSGDFAGKNSDKTREIYLADLSGATPSFQQLTNQTTIDFLKTDFGFFPSLNSSGSHVIFSSILNLAPVTTSSVTTDNGDGSREVFRYNIATGKFTQLTFTPLSDQYADQRENRTNAFINNAGNLASFSFESRSLLPAGPILSDLFQAQVRPVTGANSEVPKIANAASYDSTQVARGSLAAIFGTQLSQVTATAASANLPFELNGVTVKVAGIASQLIYVSPGQINLVVPPNVAAADAVDYSINNNGIVSSGKIKVVNIAPGVFTVTGDGKGRAAAQCGQISPDGLTFPLTAPPCDVGNTSQFNTLVLYVTGVRNAQSLTVKIGSQTLLPSYVGPQPDFPGLDQINVTLVSELAAQLDQEIIVSATNVSTVDSNKSAVSFTAAAPAITMLNAASFDGGVVATGSLAIIQGTDLAAATVTATGSELPFTLGGVSATVAGQPARLSAVSSTTITLLVPDNLKEADLAEVVIDNAGKKARGRVKILKAAAGLFTKSNDGSGPAVARCGVLNADGTVTYTDPPCAVGTEAAPKFLRLVGTGWRFANSVTVKIGESDVTTVAAGPLAGVPGNDFIDLRLVPALLGKTDLDIIVTTKVADASRTSRTGVKISFTSSN